MKGYIGPVRFDSPGQRTAAVLGEESTTKIRYLVDPQVVSGTRWVTGRMSLVGMSSTTCGRDFTPDGVIESAEIREGDPAPDGSALTLARGIEMGHIFQLGRVHAEVSSGSRCLDQTASWSR